MLVERGVKLGGPPSKAKYFSTTDSGQVGRLNGEKYPFKGSEKYLKPCTYNLWEPYGLSLRTLATGDRVPFA